MGWLTECRRTCRQTKYVGEELLWAPRSNHHGSVAATAVILDGNHVVLPGLLFLGEVQNRRFGPYQKYSLMQLRAGRRLRVFMLEVMPRHKRSHVDGSLELYGPHIQLGDEREEGDTHRVRRVISRLDVRSVNGWIRRFQRHARVYDGGNYPLTPPFHGDLFGL